MTITKQPVRRFQRCYFVYILASLSGTLYVGLTDDLRKRMTQHKAGLCDGFTRKYKADRLMYFETHSDSRIAAERQQQIRGWRREKQIALLAARTPQRQHLTPARFQTITLPPTL